MSKMMVGFPSHLLEKAMSHKLVSSKKIVSNPAAGKSAGKRGPASGSKSSSMQQLDHKTVRHAEAHLNKHFR